MAALAVVTVIGILLVRMQVQHVQRVTLERRNLLASVMDVLEQPQLAQRGMDYPALTGVYRGSPVTVTVIVDTLRVRELPTLWLSVTVRRQLPLPGPVDMLLRPSTTDIVSPGERFPAEHPAPRTWPDHIRVATPSGDRPDLQALSAALPLLHDRATKDVLVTSTGARVISELARAELGHYRVVKRSKFDARLSAEQLTVLLDSLCVMTEGIRQRAG